MPYKSDAQRRFMHARHPNIAKRWDKEVSGRPVGKPKIGRNPDVSTQPVGKPKLAAIHRRMENREKQVYKSFRKATKKAQKASSSQPGIAVGERNPSGGNQPGSLGRLAKKRNLLNKFQKASYTAKKSQARRGQMNKKQVAAMQALHRRMNKQKKSAVSQLTKYAG